MLDGYVRDIPGGAVHRWSTELSADGAWLELAWDQPQKIGQVQITFDTGFQRELTLTSQNAINAKIIRAPQPETVRDYDLEYRKSASGPWQKLATVTGNHQRWCDTASTRSKHRRFGSTSRPPMATSWPACSRCAATAEDIRQHLHRSPLCLAPDARELDSPKKVHVTNRYTPRFAERRECRDCRWPRTLKRSRWNMLAIFKSARRACLVAVAAGALIPNSAYAGIFRDAGRVFGARVDQAVSRVRGRFGSPSVVLNTVRATRQQQPLRMPRSKARFNKRTF